MMREEQDSAEQQLEQLINQQYKIWKKNTPFLYDAVISHALDWPSLTTDWMDIVQSHQSYNSHKLVLGTHTQGSEPNSLLVVNVKLPVQDAVVNGKVYLDNTNDAGGVGLLSKIDNKISIDKQMKHQGEVNKARVMPQHTQIIATKGPSGQVFVYDFQKGGLELTLTGHQKQGFGLEWNSVQQGLLASGSDDYLICIWDISEPSVCKRYNHGNVVNDISWCPNQTTILASVGDDNNLVIWDTREQNPVMVVQAHINEVNSVDFNKIYSNLLATASSDRTAAVWDLRHIGRKLKILQYHKDAVYNVRWAPFSQTMLATSSNDRRVLLWDLSRIGADQSEIQASDGPPELLFIHGGHTSKVSDFSWNNRDQFMMASTAEDNILQVWQLSYALLAYPYFGVELVEPMDLD